MLSTQTPEASTRTKTERSSTASAISKPIYLEDGSYNTERLKGEFVTVLPYARGYFARDLLYQVWYYMEKEDAIKLVFSELPHTKEPIPSGGDFVHFLGHVNQPNVIPLVIEANNEIAGFMWFQIGVPGYRAEGSEWFRRKYWGYPAREGVRLCLDYMFHSAVGVKHIWGRTPWETAMKSCLSLGFELVCVLPDFFLVRGKPKDCYLVHYGKDSFNANFA